jgi:soluble lytic murein transglycosylase-like protein
MKNFKKTTTLLLATAVLFTGKTMLDLNALGNEVETLSNQVEHLHTEQSREPMATIAVIQITAAPTKAPDPEPESEVRIYNIPLDEELQEYTFYLCKENNLDYEMVLAMMDQESDYREKVISKTNDYGIMQINQVNHEWLEEELGIDDFLDAEQNILAGIRILAELTEKYEDPHRVLMAYNCGETGAKRLWKQGKTTSEYSRSIMARAEELREEMGK